MKTSPATSLLLALSRSKHCRHVVDSLLDCGAEVALVDRIRIRAWVTGQVQYCSRACSLGQGRNTQLSSNQLG